MTDLPYLPEEMVERMSSYLPREALGRYASTSQASLRISQRALFQRKLEYLKEKILNHIKSNISEDDFNRQKQYMRVNPYFNSLGSYDDFITDQIEMLENMNYKELLFLDSLRKNMGKINLYEIVIDLESDLVGFYINNKKIMLISRR